VGLGIYLFTTASRRTLGHTQPPIQWVPGDLSLGVKRPGREADHSPPSSAKVKECVELYLHSLYTPSWRGAQLKHRDNFTFTVNNHSGSQEIPCLLWNPKIHYCVHKGPSLIRILNQIHPVHTFPLHFPKIYSKIIFLILLCLPSGLFLSGTSETCKVETKSYDRQRMFLECQHDVAVSCPYDRDQYFVVL
jgi:hypothetical protein